MKKKIIFLDDEKFMRDLAMTIEEFEVIVVSKGEDVIKLYDDSITGVVMDLKINNGGLGGIETIKKLKEIDPEVKAIAMSGDTFNDVILNPSDYGFSASLAKPFVLRELVETIKSY